jgi:spoIIIJ-associated protein
MEKAKDFYSKDVAEAIRQACAEFATSQEHLNIEVVETGSAGIFGLCRKRAHIRATLKQASGGAKKTKAQVEAPAVDHVDEKESDASVASSVKTLEPEQKKSGKGRQKVRSQQKPKKTEKVRTPPVELEPIEPPSEEVLASVKSDLDHVLQLMGFPSDTSVTFEKTAIQCQINGEYEENIVGSDGRTLDSLQYLLRKMSSRELPDRMMIDLNAGDFRERREEELKKIAVELAEQVKVDGKTQAIPALNPSERRVVHVTLQDDKSIRSRSVGDGLFKKVLIYKPGSKTKKTGGRRRGRQSGDSTDK